MWLFRRFSISYQYPCTNPTSNHSHRSDQSRISYISVFPGSWIHHCIPSFHCSISDICEKTFSEVQNTHEADIPSHTEDILIPQPVFHIFRFQFFQCLQENKETGYDSLPNNRTVCIHIDTVRHQLHYICFAAAGVSILFRIYCA